MIFEMYDYSETNEEGESETYNLEANSILEAAQKVKEKFPNDIEHLYLWRNSEEKGFVSEILRRI